MATMNYCPQCRTAIQHGAAFCANCGHQFGGPATPGSASSVMGREQAVGIELRYMIPLGRVLFMSIISYGLYFPYWFYLTWKHYRDHTGEEAYPVWHAMTLSVPIYAYFRVHAHMSAFAELMRREKLETSISPGWAVVAVIVSGSMFIVTGDMEAGDLSQGSALSVAVLDTIAIGILAWLLLHVQTNLNSYWHYCSEGRLLAARVGVGEVIIAVIGGLAWFDTLANLFSSAYRSVL